MDAIGERLGKIDIVRGLARTFVVEPRNGLSIPAEFATMEFRAGIVLPDDTVTPISITDKNNNSGSFIVTVSALSTVLLTNDTSSIQIIFKYDSTDQAKPLGYIDVEIGDWGISWS